MTTASPSSDLRLSPGPANSLVDVPGIEVGHYTHDTVKRGVTAVLCKGGAIVGVSVRGSNPGTFNTDALSPTGIGGLVHGIGLTGGSLFGLAALSGMIEWLYEQQAGLRLRDVLIPIVSGAVIWDLFYTDATVHPTPEWGRLAAGNASSRPFARGNVGAGIGGTAGKGPGCVRTKGGLGTASLLLPGGIVVGAIVVINALGGVVHPVSGELYATHGGFDVPLLYQQLDAPPVPGDAMANTTLGVIATNAQLSGSQVTKVADLAHDGLARAIRPIHAMLDGDTIFAMSVNDSASGPGETTEAFLTDMIGAAAADVMVLAVLDAARETNGEGEWPSVSDAQQAIQLPTE